MKKSLFITLIIFTIFSVIIIAGCGGSNDVVPSAIVTPATTTNENEQKGTLVIKVKWPQEGMDGSCAVASGGNEDTLIASMPYDTERISIEVYEAHGLKLQMK